MTPRVRRSQSFDALVIGGGQAGLAMGRHLQRSGQRFLILDGAAQVGASWRSRWDSLRLFTPARYSALPDLPFPADPDHLPTKDEVADYLTGYARTFSLPLALDEPVRELRVLGPNRLRVTTAFAAYEARHVVVATGGHQAPHVPAASRSLSRRVLQIHSSEYRSPAQLPAGPVVVVGAGNSGVQIAAELAPTHDVVLATGTSLRPVPTRLFGKSLFWWLESTGAMSVTADSPLGRRARHVELLLGDTPQQLARRLGVRLAPRITGAEGSALTSSDGTRHEAATVIWATGFRPSYPWLHAPVFDGNGRPRQTRGLTELPGLAFLGLPWMHTRGSSLLGWVGRDAEYLAQQIAPKVLRSAA